MIGKILVIVILIIVLIAPWMTRGVMNEIIAENYPNCDELDGFESGSATTKISSKWFPFGRKITGCNKQPIILAFDPRISSALVSGPSNDNEEVDGETNDGFWADWFYIPQPRNLDGTDPNPEGAGVFN